MCARLVKIDPNENAVLIKVKRFSPKAVIPSYAKPGDAGMDLTATKVEYLPGYVNVEFDIGFEIPPGFVGLMFPRSSVYKTGFSMSNCVGVIDSGYRGAVSAKFYYNSVEHAGIFAQDFKEGDRAAQIIFVPIPFTVLKEVDELAESERGTGGFGSTGK